MDILLYREQHLIGVYGLDDVVSNLRAYGLIHNILLLALGHHNNGRGGAHILNQRKRLQSRHTGHHLVENNQIKGHRAYHIDSVVTVVTRLYIVALALKK